MSENEVLKVSSELVKAKMNFQPDLKGKQLLYFSIFDWSNTKNLEVRYSRAEFKETFGVDFTSVKEIEKTLDKLSLVQYRIKKIDKKKERLEYINMFSYISYYDQEFVVKFNKDIVPILELEKEKFLLLEMQTLARFRSKFSLILLEKIKLSWWDEMTKKIKLTKEQLYDIFYVEKDSLYRKDFYRFKLKVLDLAIKEINEFTGYRVSYEEVKKGKKVIAIDMIVTNIKQSITKQKNKFKQATTTDYENYDWLEEE